MNTAVSIWLFVAIACLSILATLVWIPRRRFTSSPVPHRRKLLRMLWSIALLSAALTLVSVSVAIADNYPHITLVDIAALVMVAFLIGMFLFRALRPEQPDQNYP